MIQMPSKTAGFFNRSVSLEPRDSLYLESYMDRGIEGIHLKWVSLLTDCIALNHMYGAIPIVISLEMERRDFHSWDDRVQV